VIFATVRMDNNRQEVSPVDEEGRLVLRMYGERNCKVSKQSK